MTRDVTDRLRSPGPWKKPLLHTPVGDICGTNWWLVVASCTCCWILLGCMWNWSVIHKHINTATPSYMWLKCRFKHILKTLGCQLRIWSGQTCWATCWPIPKLTLTYILSPWKFEKTSLPKVLDLDVKNKASKKGEYQQISSQGNRNMDA